MRETFSIHLKKIDAVAAAMYTIGFAETVRDILKVNIETVLTFGFFKSINSGKWSKSLRNSGRW